MAIEIRQPGEAKLATVTGTVIGKAERAKEERARAERQQEIAARQRAEQVAMDWELQKMQLRSQQEFEQELREKQWEYDKINAAKQWDVEKMQIASRIDFEEKEKERQRQLSEISNKRLAIQKAVETRQYTSEQIKQKSDELDILEQSIRIGISPSQIGGIKEEEPLIKERKIAKALYGDMADITPLNQIREDAKADFGIDISGGEVRKIEKVTEEGEHGLDIPAGTGGYLGYFKEEREAGRIPMTMAQWEAQQPKGLKQESEYARRMIGLYSYPIATDKVSEISKETEPIRVKSVEEARALAPGTIFITPDGRRKVR